MITEDSVREKAYLLWEEAGKPEGDGSEFWFEAEKQLQILEKCDNIKDKLKSVLSQFFVKNE